MTKDVIALTERMPDTWSLLAGLLSGGPDVTMGTAADDAVIQLFDAEGRPLASVETPTLVRVPGEVRRLLGIRAEGPVWWTEVRAATAGQGSDRLAGVLASRLVSQLGGRVWPADAFVTDLGRPVSGLTGAAQPAAAQPAVDVLSDRAAVVIQDRPLVAMTSWLAEALRAAADSDRGFQLVTPASARLTLATRAALAGAPNRWVVGDGASGYYDGLSGTELRWSDGAFVPAGATASAFTAGGAGAAGGAAPAAGPGDAAKGGSARERQFALSIRTRKPAEAELLLGGALEAAWRHLLGGPPSGWGTAEPAGQPWSRAELTDFVRDRSPAPTWTVAVGDPDRPAVATLRTELTTGGVEEELTLTLGYRVPGEGAAARTASEPAEEADEFAPARFADLAALLAAEHGLVSMLVQRRAARADLTVPPWLEGAPTVLGFAVGREDVRAAGLTRARRPPLPIRPIQLGPLDRAAFYYPFAETEPGAGWGALEDLVTHLREAASPTPTPGPPDDAARG
ncbi:DUF6177 family protein [Streptomyces sp. 71268]|uniref:DUF6177 family protein n=1 Tax=Streptomyces sp. 71268 TaxID=3002640 RepID=UPI0023F88B20|nr:DUF6177 family protein [Streptomyces sp. 71268]WEV26361.1 DUF6177 family protein [Streptomyces sp. 71268]